MTNERPWLTVQHDTKYDLGTLNVRFTVPLGVSYEGAVALAQPHVKKAIEDWERLGDGFGHKWRFYDKIPVQYRVSDIQWISPAKLAGDVLKHKDKYAAKSVGDRIAEVGEVAMVATLYFIRPLALVDPDEEREYKELGYADGFVPREDMPEGWLK